MPKSAIPWVFCSSTTPTRPGTATTCSTSTSPPPRAFRSRCRPSTFSGEEMGLLGSIHYCKHPLFPLDDTVAMVNLDMVGRARTDPKTGADKLIVYGSDTATNFSELIDRVNKPHGLELKKVGTGSGDRIFAASDHASFYDVKVPVYFFFTGDHEDYHRPSDRVERINVPGMRRVTDLTEDLVAQLAAADERPKYVKIK